MSEEHLLKVKSSVIRVDNGVLFSHSSTILFEVHNLARQTLIRVIVTRKPSYR